MTRFAAFVLLAALTALAVGGCKKKEEAGGGGGTTSDDKALAQGDWVAEKVEGMDPPLTAEELKNSSGSIKDNLIALNFDGHKMYWVFTLDPSKSPKWVDLAEANEKGEIRKSYSVDAKGKKSEPKDREKALGVYKLEGDRLTIACGMPGAPRPTEFKAVTGRPDVPEKESGQVLVLTLVRKK